MLLRYEAKRWVLLNALDMNSEYCYNLIVLLTKLFAKIEATPLHHVIEIIKKYIIFIFYRLVYLIRN